MPALDSESTIQVDALTLFAIPTESLKIDTITDFDLYLPPCEGQSPVIYRKSHLPFTEAVRDRLVQHGILELYVSTQQRRAYQRYLEDTLGEVLRDTSLPMEIRCNRLYESAQGLVREILDEPRAGQARGRSAKLVKQMTKFIYGESQSFQHLMKVTSFDYYTYTHSVNVFVFTTALAQELGFGEDSVRVLGQGALLHDLGKSMIHPSIVTCKGKLSEAQWQQMKLHPLYGYDILREQGETNAVILDVVRHHHEKINGGGYPDGLRGNQISHWARMCAIADIFDALTTQRAYKNAMESFPTLQFMQREMQAELDPEFFRAFINLMGQASG